MIQIQNDAISSDAIINNESPTQCDRVTNYPVSKHFSVIVCITVSVSSPGSLILPFLLSSLVHENRLSMPHIYIQATLTPAKLGT